MDAIFNNPFRILGLSTTASDKEISKRVSDLLIYAEMGKKVTYDTDLPFLGEVDRSAQSVKNALHKIELPDNRIFYSLLWFDLNDNVSRSSIELYEKGDIPEANKVIKDSIFINSPIVYNVGERISEHLSNFNQIEHPEYVITVHSPRKNPDAEYNTSIKYRRIVFVKENDEFVDIKEATCKIDLLDKYQLGFSFSFPSYKDPPILRPEVCFRIGFTDNSNLEHYISLSHNGLLSFNRTDKIEAEKIIDKSLFNEGKRNYLSINIYDNILEIKHNSQSVLKIGNNIKFKSSFLKIPGRQTIVVEDLAISRLENRKNLILNVELNKITFSYIKHLSIYTLLFILKEKKVRSTLISYFSDIGNFFKNPYFESYTKEIVGENHKCNISTINDKFVSEFYYSLYQFVDHSFEFAELGFYNSFKRLSDSAEKQIKELAIGSKLYCFENFIREVSVKRVKNPQDSNNLARELITETNIFASFYSQFFHYDSLEVKSISDKISIEIVECSIAYYNSSSERGNTIARLSLELLTCASDFAISQVLRNRINENIAALLKNFAIKEFDIIDFDLKDRMKYQGIFSMVREKDAQGKKDDGAGSGKTIPNKMVNNKGENKSINDKNTDIQIAFQWIKSKAIILIPLIIILGIIFYSNQNESKTPNNDLIETHSTLPEVKSFSSTTKWRGNKLENGTSPYDSYFGKGIYDYSSKCWIKFKNGNSTDVIVCLENVYTGTTIRNEYIRVGSEYTMSNLPVGVYKIKVFYGKDWNPEKSLKNGAIIGAFDIDSNFSVSDNPNDLVNISITTTNDGISYSTFEITLYTVSNGNMNQRNINSDEFFK